MYLINTNPKSLKSKRVRQTEEEKKKLAESLSLNKYKFKRSLLRDATKCKHNRNIDEIHGEIYCSKCYTIYDFWNVHNDQDEKVKGSNIVIWDRQYDKSRWTGYSIDAMMGKINWELPDQCWLELIREIPDPFKWYDVYKVFQKYQLLKYWIAFGNFIDKPPKLNKKIMAHFAKYMEIGHGKYSISYYYLLYKFTQLFGDEGDEQYIPLKNSITWCKKTDLWWKEICEKEGWEFKPTKVYSINWDKEQYLRKFASCVKSYIKNTQSNHEQ